MNGGFPHMLIQESFVNFIASDTWPQLDKLVGNFAPQDPELKMVSDTLYYEESLNSTHDVFVK